MALIDSMWYKYHCKLLLLFLASGSRGITFVASPPRNTSVEKGKSVVLECLAGGNPRPQVSWHRLGEGSAKPQNLLSKFLLTYHSKCCNCSTYLRITACVVTVPIYISHVTFSEQSQTIKQVIYCDYFLLVILFCKSRYLPPKITVMDCTVVVIIYWK